MPLNDPAPLRVLIVEDTEQDAELMALQLEMHGFSVESTRVDSPADLRAHLAAADWDLALSDYRMPGFTALDALRIVAETRANLPFIIVSGAIGEEIAVQAMKLGARDYVNKSHLARLGPVVERELAEARHRASARHAEAELRRTQLEFRTLANGIPQLVWMADGEGRAFWFNQRWFDYTGASPAESTGEGWTSYHHPDHRARARDSFARCIREGELWEETLPIRGHHGEWRWFLNRALPIRGQDRAGAEVERWFGTATDITEQLAAQEELRASGQALRDALSARDEFLSVASHELKTPLCSLRLQAQGLRRAIDRGDAAALLPERVRRLAEQTDRQVSRLARLVDDMLDMSNIQAGRMVIRREREGLADVVRGVVERMHDPMVAAGCAPVIEELADIDVGIDRSRIEQVLTNLLTNAMKYGGGRPVEIRLERVIDPSLGARARVTVRDHGIGIAKESHERIFNRFERAISSSEVAGLGLGLFISRQIVQAHDGRIWVESEPGHGSEFRFELPAVDEAGAAGLPRAG